VCEFIRKMRLRGLYGKKSTKENGIKRFRIVLIFQMESSGFKTLSYENSILDLMVKPFPFIFFEFLKLSPKDF
jgi:hypothetical protein